MRLSFIGICRDAIRVYGLGPTWRFMGTWRSKGLSKSIISRVMIGVTPFRVLITLLKTYLLSPPGSKKGLCRVLRWLRV